MRFRLLPAVLFHEVAEPFMRMGACMTLVAHKGQALKVVGHLVLAWTPWIIVIEIQLCQTPLPH